MHESAHCQRWLPDLPYLICGNCVRHLTVLAGVCHNLLLPMNLLAENCANHTPWCVCLENRWQSKIGVCQHKAQAQGILQRLESLILFNTPAPCCAFLQQFVKRCSNAGKVSTYCLQWLHMPMKDCRQSSPCGGLKLHRLHLAWIWANSSRRYDMAKVYDLIEAKGTLFQHRRRHIAIVVCQAPCPSRAEKCEWYCISRMASFRTQRLLHGWRQFSHKLAFPAGPTRIQKLRQQ